VYDAILKITKRNASISVNSEESLLFRLQSWWSNHYNRPLKDPLLLSYTLEELLFEYHDKDQRHLAELMSSEQEADNIERDRLQTNLDWAEQEELKERKAEEEKKIKQEADEKWMQEQLLKEGKGQFGEDFGNDISEDFES
jgi:hypothetical protein